MSSRGPPPLAIVPPATGNGDVVPLSAHMGLKAENTTLRQERRALRQRAEAAELRTQNAEQVAAVLWAAFRKTREGIRPDIALQLAAGISDDHRFQQWFAEVAAIFETE